MLFFEICFFLIFNYVNPLAFLPLQEDNLISNTGFVNHLFLISSFSIITGCHHISWSNDRHAFGETSF